MKIKIQFDETDDLIDIRYDNVFKAVFAKNNPYPWEHYQGLFQL